MRALIITAKGFQDQEFIYPYYRLQEAGYEVDVVTPNNLTAVGIQGIPATPNMVYDGRHMLNDYPLVVIPGGVKAMEKLRLEVPLTDHLARHHSNGGVIASICSGAQMLISAGLVKGRTISCYPAMAIDVMNAGGKFSAVPTVCERIVTAPHYRDLGRWMKLTLEEVERVL